MGKREIVDEIEQSDMVACTVSWVLVSIYVQIALTYLAIVRTTLLNHSLFLIAITTFFISVLCYVQFTLSPKVIIIVDEKE